METPRRLQELHAALEAGTGKQGLFVAFVKAMHEAFEEGRCAGKLAPNPYTLQETP